jgi:hypothetical protein
MRLVRGLGDLERRTRPNDAHSAAAVTRRWGKLPETVKTPGQVLGRFGLGCEATHKVFSACNLTCTPCYHSRDAKIDAVPPARSITATP